MVVSPHRDDAIFSCGQYLTLAEDVVVNVMAGAPEPPEQTPYDQACGFGDSDQAWRARAAEDHEALRIVGATNVSFPYLDWQYPDPFGRPDAVMLAFGLYQVYIDNHCEGIVGPLGLQHPDHLLVSEACVLLAHANLPVWLAEDLPYRVAYPETMGPRLRAVERQGWTPRLDFLGAGPIETKEAAVQCYRSQTFDIHSVLVPERYWRLFG